MTFAGRLILGPLEFALLTKALRAPYFESLKINERIKRARPEELERIAAVYELYPTTPAGRKAAAQDSGWRVV